jgi:hypothetical protein
MTELREALREIMNTPCKGCSKAKNCRELEEGEALCSRDEDRIIKLIQQYFDEIAKEKGYVKLAENQELPDNPYSVFDHDFECRVGYYEGQQDMLKAGFRKIDSKEKENGS